MDYFQLILLALATPFTLIWIYLAITGGKKYYMLLGAKTTYTYTIVIVVMLLSAMSNNKGLLFMGLIVGGLLILYLDLALFDKLTARRQEILLDLPQVLSKLTLLVNSGMVLRDAWKRVSIPGNAEY